MFKPLGLNISHSKDCFNYLNNHFMYWTMNSWNREKSIANNVKVYNLSDLANNVNDVLDLLYTQDYIWDTLNAQLDAFNVIYPDYAIGFNGRSDGYLVLYNKNNNSNVLPDIITDCDNYEDFKAELKSQGYTLKDYERELRDYVNLVRDFDILCDDMVRILDYETTLFLERKEIKK